MDDFKRLRGRPGIVLAGLMLPLLVLPALAVGLIAGFAPSAATATGLLLIAACPIGGISNFYSHLARASTALSVVLTGSSCLLATLTIPALSVVYELALARPLGLHAPLPLFFVQITFMLLLPVAMGMWVKRRWPEGVERNRAWVQRSSFVAIALLIGLIIGSDLPTFSMTWRCPYRSPRCS